MQSSKTLAAELGNLGLLWGVPLGMFGASGLRESADKSASRAAPLTPCPRPRPTGMWFIWPAVKLEFKQDLGLHNFPGITGVPPPVEE